MTGNITPHPSRLELARRVACQRIGRHAIGCPEVREPDDAAPGGA